MKFYIAAFLLSLMMIPVLAVPFLPAVGGKPSKKDRSDYKERAENYDGKNFANLKPVLFMDKVKDEDPDRLSEKQVRPDYILPEKRPSLLENPGTGDFSLTWLGHSTVLMQMHGMNILIDPVFSRRISPVTWAGPEKFAVRDFDFGSLPEIDILVLSHDHYDHLDYQTIKKIDKKVKKYIVPLGVEAHLKKWKVDEKKVINMAWWEETRIRGLSITAVPAQHFSGRWITGRNQTLWCGYVFKDEFHRVFDSGDSGYGEHFKDIKDKFGGFDLAILECGQYNKRWPEIHSFPEETVQAAIELNAKVSMPVHWGSIVLSTNGWDDSVLRFVKNAEEKKVNYITPYMGQTVNLEKPEDYREQWWK